MLMNRVRNGVVAWSRSMSVVPTTKLFINGKFVDSKTEDWIDVHNPATNEVLHLRVINNHTCTCIGLNRMIIL